MSLKENEWWMLADKDRNLRWYMGRYNTPLLWETRKEAKQHKVNKNEIPVKVKIVKVK